MGGDIETATHRGRESRRERIAPTPTSEDDGTDEVLAELILGHSLRPGHNQTNILLTLLWIDEAAAALGDATVEHQEPLYRTNYNRNLLTPLENFTLALHSCPFERSSHKYKSDDGHFMVISRRPSSSQPSLRHMLRQHDQGSHHVQNQKQPLAVFQVTASAGAEEPASAGATSTSPLLPTRRHRRQRQRELITNHPASRTTQLLSI